MRSWEDIVREAVRQIIRHHKLIAPGEKVVAGVSGGTDSLALLHLLKNLSDRMGFSIRAATLDHHLRGKESAEDVNFVVAICDQWGIPVSQKKVNVKTMAKRSQTSIEVAARNARYDFLAEVAHQVGASCVAVAHHADDQAETVLMRLLRGSGGKGLAGMALQSPLPGHPDLRLIRPLLYASRLSLEAYCQQHNLSPREDSTNTDTTILRNRIRHELLPFLSQYQSNISQTLSRTAEISGIENSYFDQEIERIIATEIAVESPGQVRLNREAFRHLHPALQHRLVIWSLNRLGGADELDYQHIVEAVSLGVSGRQGAISLFSSGFRLRVDYDLLVIESHNTPSPPATFPLIEKDQIIELNVPCVVRLNTWQLQISLHPFPVSDPYPVCSLALPDQATLTLRTRRDGDRFAPLGLGGHTQKINRFMINDKVPRPVRDRIPLVCVNQQIAAFRTDSVWVISETFRVNRDSRRIIYVRFMENS